MFCSTVVESTIIKILMTMPILFIVSETKPRWYGHAGLAVAVLVSETWCPVMLKQTRGVATLVTSLLWLA
jgi:hypothetical protein